MSGRRPSSRARLVPVLLACLLTASACGARWTDEQSTGLRDRYAGSRGAASGAAAGPSGSAGAGSQASTAAGAAAGATAAAAGPAGASGGDGSVDPAETAGGAAVDSALPCSAPSTAPGVTDGEIRVATISSLSGPVPGLGASAAGAARAYVAFRNAIGGVCGRQIVLDEVDDGTDNGRYRTLIAQVAEQDLGVVGGFSVGDVGGIDVIRDTAIPIVSVVSSDTLTALPTVFDINPPIPNPDVAIGKYRYLYEQGARTVSQVYIAVDQSRALAAIEQRMMRAAGLEIVQVQELPLSTLSYDAAARSVVNSGADYMTYIGPAEGNASLARSLDDIDASLLFEEYYSLAYGTSFVEAAGEAGNGAITWLRSLPVEEAGSNPELTNYLEWMELAAPGEPTDEYASNSWTAAKAFFDSLEAIPGPISREALVAQLASVGTFDAGGMMGPIQLGNKVTGACYVGLTLDAGAWRRFTPTEGFLC